MVMSMPVDRDPICALATPPGTAGLAVIRVSGSAAMTLCDTFFRGSMALDETPASTVRHGWWVVDGLPVDEVTCTVFRRPASYTGEDTVEIGCHGGVHVVDHILTSLHRLGIRTADPGEFTRRAFLNGKLDLPKVEAVADLIHAQSSLGVRTAARQLAGGFTKRLAAIHDDLMDIGSLLELELDFAEEDVSFVERPTLLAKLDDVRSFAQALARTARSAEVLRAGFTCAVVGAPNAGKSSLFNALLGRPRAIVSDTAGTTRDYLSEPLLIDGYAVHLTDTAGLRDTDDTVERHGIILTSSIIEQADMVVVVNDVSLGVDRGAELAAAIGDLLDDHHALLIVQNKADLLDDAPVLPEGQVLCSAQTGAGVSDVLTLIVAQARRSTSGIADVLVNARQAVLLRGVAEACAAAAAAVTAGNTNDVVAIDVRAAIRLLGELSGETWNPDVLDGIFSRFCIGK